MKNTRKKMLLSSIAMLLVALIALGSATFAWYTTNPRASASGLTLKSTAANGLEVCTSTHQAAAGQKDWVHTDYFNYVDNSGTPGSSTTPIALDPRSFDVAGDFTSAYKVEADDEDNYVAASDATVTSESNGFYQEDVYCRLSGAANSTDTAAFEITSLAITPVAGAKQINGIRVALQYNGTLIGIYTPTAQSNKYLTATGTYNTSLSGSNYSFKANSAAATDFGTSHVVGTTGNDKFTVTVYLDGENTSVKTKNIEAQNIISSIALNLALVS